MIATVIGLIELTGLNGQQILLNPSEVVTLRAPRSSEHFGPGISCLINTADGKFIAVVEMCQTVRALLQREPQ